MSGRRAVVLAVALALWVGLLGLTQRCDGEDAGGWPATGSVESPVERVLNRVWPF